MSPSASAALRSPRRVFDTGNDSPRTSTQPSLSNYDRASAIACPRAAFVLSSVIAPLTTRYTRVVVPPRQWTDPRFVDANATLSRSWSAVLALIAAALTVGAIFEDPLATMVFNSLFPIYVVAVAAVRLAPRSENTSGVTAVRALESLMSAPRDGPHVRTSLRRLGW